MYSKLIGKSRAEAIPQGFSGESNPGIIRRFSRFVRGNFFIPDARIGWIRYAVKEARKIIAEQKIDTIITTGPPHSTHIIGLKLKRKFNLKWIADFRDPWTEVFYNKLFYRTTLAKSIDQRLEKRVLKESDFVLTIGASMAKMLAEKSDINKVGYILNGFDHEVFKNLKSSKNKEVFTICHLGILSDNQPVDGFIEAMKIFMTLEERTPQLVKLLLIGKISPGILDKFRSEIPELKIEMKDYMSHDQAMQQIMNADLLFNSLAEVSNGNYLISGKLMEYIATGNPILCLGDENGDASVLLNEFRDAKVIDRKNIDGIYRHILNIFNKWKEGVKETGIIENEKYSRYNSTAQLADIIKKLN